MRDKIFELFQTIFLRELMLHQQVNHFENTYISSREKNPEKTHKFIVTKKIGRIENKVEICQEGEAQRVQERVSSRAVVDGDVSVELSPLLFYLTSRKVKRCQLQCGQPGEDSKKQLLSPSHLLVHSHHQLCPDKLFFNVLFIDNTGVVWGEILISVRRIRNPQPRTITIEKL